MHITLLDALESGAKRAIQPCEDGTWLADVSVKQAILNLLRDTPVAHHAVFGYTFLDKLSIRWMTPSHGVRMPPGGTAIRRGAYIGKGVVIMPPSYVNIGAYVDHDTMIDSHVLVGSCAYVGPRVHLSAGVQIGGVLEPVGAQPVVIESDVFVGAGAVLTEGIWVRSYAVIAPGVALSASTPIFDTVHQTTYKGMVPKGAVVISGTRPLNTPWAQQQNLQAYAAIIVKYRDQHTDARLATEPALHNYTHHDSKCLF
jgi:2,3,4,5-tetrahydropyridine-2,6-dicarboxylate N-succinyltransferase